MLMRKEKNKNFTLVDNYMINDLNITPANKGVLLFMLSKPDNWNFNFEYLKKGLGIGIKAVRSNLSALEKANYLKRRQYKDDKGHYQWEYFIYDIPYDLELNKYPYTPKGYVDEEHAAQGDVYKYCNKEIDKIDKDKNRFSIYTQKLLERGYVGINEYNLSYYDNLFYECLNSGYDKYDILKSINYVCNHVASNNFTDEYGYKIENKFKNTGNILDYNWLEDRDR